MRKCTIRKGISLAMVAAMSMAIMTGCGSKEATVEIPQEETPLSSSVSAGYVEALNSEDVTTGTEKAAGTYFTKGVYASYAAEAENPEKTYFYVFSGDGWGSIEDGETDSSVFFEYAEKDGSVTFNIGSQEPIEDILTIKSCENGIVKGAFIDTIDLVFELVPDADPDNFKAVNYVNAARGEDFVFDHSNGWRVRYNPNCIEVNGNGPVTTFVYTGECAGTCMITASYGIENDAKAAADAIAKEWGDKATVNECVFPGTENVKGYYVYLPSEEPGVGLTMSAFFRDYMDGYLEFEFTTHNSGNDEIDIPVSDALSAIIDTLEFPFEK